MQIKHQLLLVSLGFVAIGAQADDSFSDRFRYAPDDTGYAANTFNVDIFGSWASRGRSGEDDGKLGIGGGVSYFLTRNLGIDAHTYADAFKEPYNLNTSVIYRYPIEGTAWAPYGFGGFGRQWDYASQWLFHIGLGGEYRINPHTGVFLDWRRVFALETDDYHLVRLGVRLGF